MDAGREAQPGPDAAPDVAPIDGDDGGAEADAPTLDAGPRCTTDAIVLAVMLDANLPDSFALEVFHPSTGAVTLSGTFDCQPRPGARAQVTGLAVDRSGGLYAAWGEDSVYRVEATDGGFACQAPNLVVSSFNLQPIGIAFVGQSDGGEELFGSFLWVQSGLEASDPLAIIGLHGETADIVGGGGSPATSGGLTGTGDGRLFLLLADSVVQVEPTTGSIVRTIPLPTTPPSLVPSGTVPAPIAFFGGDFYVFAPAVPLSDGGLDYSRSGIVRFRPSDGTLVLVGAADGHVTGAAVSTCAPLQ